MQNNKIKSVTPSRVWKNVAITFFAIGLATIVIGFILRTFACKVVGGTILLLSLTFYTVWKSLHITYTDTQWVLRRWFFGEKVYSYKDIRAITFGTASGGYTLRLSKGNLHIGRYAEGGEAFRAWADRRYARLHENRRIPYEPPHLFHNNVNNPLEFLMLFSCVGALIFAAAIWITIGLSEERAIPPLKVQRITVLNVTVEGNQWILSAPSGKYLVSQEAASEDITGVQGSVITVLVEADSTGQKNESVQLWSAWDATDRNLFSPQEVQAAWGRRDRVTIGLLWSVVALYVLFWFFCFYILNHAHEHPRLASFFVKKSNRNF